MQAALSATATAPEPTAAVISLLTGQPTASLGGSIQKGSSSSIAYSHSDERIWAAQFTPLKVDFYPHGVSEDSQGLSRVLLRELPDLGDSAIRGDEQSTPNESNLETAIVHGLEEETVRLYDQDPDSLLPLIGDTDWDLLDRLEEQIWMQDGRSDSNVTMKSVQ